MQNIVTAATAVSIILSGCGLANPWGDRLFETVAVYEAPKSGYRLEVIATGTIKDGADVCDGACEGEAKIVPKEQSAAKRAVRLTIRNYDIVQTMVDELEQGGVKGADAEESKKISNLLLKAGYKQLAPDEIDETVRAIRGAVAGPKGTMMQGQTRHLAVIDIDF